MKTVTLSISGMTCGHCVSNVRKALGAVPGVAVRDVRIGSAEVALDDASNAEAAIAAVQDAGYEAALARTDVAAKTASPGGSCCASVPATLSPAGGSSRHVQEKSR